MAPVATLRSPDSSGRGSPFHSLGLRNAAVCCASRKCACRRELNSHNAAEPRMNRRCWLAHGSEVGRVAQHKPAPAPAKSAPLRKQAPRTTTWCCGEQLVQPCSSQHNREDNEPGGRSWAHATNENGETTLLARNARRRAPCKALGVRRRRGVPRLLLPWRAARSRITAMQKAHRSAGRAH